MVLAVRVLGYTPPTLRAGGGSAEQPPPPSPQRPLSLSRSLLLTCAVLHALRCSLSASGRVDRRLGVCQEKTLRFDTAKAR